MRLGLRRKSQNDPVGIGPSDLCSDTTSLLPGAQFALIHPPDREIVEAFDSRTGGQTSSSEEPAIPTAKGVPGPAKMVILFQSVIMIFLAFWAYQEFLYNQYLQDYVNSYLQGTGLLVVVLGSIGVFVLVGLVLYSKLRHTRRVLETSGQLKKGKKEDPGSTKILEPHVEQHLIDMLRRTPPADSSTGQTMPVLNREEPQASSN